MPARPAPAAARLALAFALALGAGALLAPAPAEARGSGNKTRTLYDGDKLTPRDAEEVHCDALLSGGRCFYRIEGDALTFLGINPGAAFELKHDDDITFLEKAKGRPDPIKCDARLKGGKCFYTRKGKLLGANPGGAFALDHGKGFKFRADADAATLPIEKCNAILSGGECFYNAAGGFVGANPGGPFALASGMTDFKFLSAPGGTKETLSCARTDGAACEFKADGRLAPFSLAEGDAQTAPTASDRVACGPVPGDAAGTCFHGGDRSLLGANPGGPFALDHGEDFDFRADADATTRTLACDALRPGGRCFYGADGAPPVVTPGGKFSIDDGESILFRADADSATKTLSCARSDGEACAFNAQGSVLPFALPHGASQTAPVAAGPCNALLSGGRCFYDRGGKLLGANPGGPFALGHGDSFVFREKIHGREKDLACDALLAGGRCFHRGDGALLGANPGAAFSLADGRTGFRLLVAADIDAAVAARRSAKTLSCARSDDAACEFKADGSLAPFSLAEGGSQTAPIASDRVDCGDVPGDAKGACFHGGNRERLGANPGGAFSLANGRTDFVLLASADGTPKPLHCERSDGAACEFKADGGLKAFSLAEGGSQTAPTASDSVACDPVPGAAEGTCFYNYAEKKGEPIGVNPGGEFWIPDGKSLPFPFLASADDTPEKIGPCDAYRDDVGRCIYNADGSLRGVDPSGPVEVAQGDREPFFTLDSGTPTITVLGVTYSGDWFAPFIVTYSKTSDCERSDGAPCAFNARATPLPFSLPHKGSQTKPVAVGECNALLDSGVCFHEGNGAPLGASPGGAFDIADGGDFVFLAAADGTPETLSCARDDDGPCKFEADGTPAPFSLPNGASQTAPVAAGPCRDSAGCNYDGDGILIPPAPFSLAHEGTRTIDGVVITCNALLAGGTCFYLGDTTLLGANPGGAFSLDDGDDFDFRAGADSATTEITCDALLDGGECFHGADGALLGANPGAAFSLGHGDDFKFRPDADSATTEITCDALLAGGKCFYDAGGDLIGANPKAAFSLDHGEEFIFLPSADGTPWKRTCRDSEGCKYNSRGQQIRHPFTLAHGGERTVNGVEITCDALRAGGKCFHARRGRLLGANPGGAFEIADGRADFVFLDSAAGTPKPLLCARSDDGPCAFEADGSLAPFSLAESSSQTAPTLSDTVACGPVPGAARGECFYDGGRNPIGSNPGGAFEVADGGEFVFLAAADGTPRTLLCARSDDAPCAFEADGSLKPFSLAESGSQTAPTLSDTVACGPVPGAARGECFYDAGRSLLGSNPGGAFPLDHGDDFDFRPDADSATTEITCDALLAGGACFYDAAGAFLGANPGGAFPVADGASFDFRAGADSATTTLSCARDDGGACAFEADGSLAPFSLPEGGSQAAPTASDRVACGPVPGDAAGTCFYDGERNLLGASPGGPFPVADGDSFDFRAGADSATKTLSCARAGAAGTKCPFAADGSPAPFSLPDGASQTAPVAAGPCRDSAGCDYDGEGNLIPPGPFSLAHGGTRTIDGVVVTCDALLAGGTCFYLGDATLLGASPGAPFPLDHGDEFKFRAGADSATTEITCDALLAGGTCFYRGDGALLGVNPGGDFSIADGDSFDLLPGADGTPKTLSCARSDGGSCAFEADGSLKPFSLAEGDAQTAPTASDRVACGPVPGDAAGTCFYGGDRTLLGSNPNGDFPLADGRTDFVFLASAGGTPKTLSCARAGAAVGKCPFAADGGLKPFSLPEGGSQSAPTASDRVACGPVPGDATGTCFYGGDRTLLGSNPGGAFSLEYLVSFDFRLVAAFATRTLICRDSAGCEYGPGGPPLPRSPFSLAHDGTRTIDGVVITCNALLVGGACFYDAAGALLGANPNGDFSLPHGEEFTFLASADGTAKVLSCAVPGGAGRCRYSSAGDLLGFETTAPFHLAEGPDKGTGTTARIFLPDGGERLAFCRGDGRGTCYFRADGRLRYRAGRAAFAPAIAIAFAFDPNFAKHDPKQFPVDDSRYPSASGPHAGLLEEFLKTDPSSHLVRIGAIAAHEGGTTGAEVQSSDPAKRRAQTSVTIHDWQSGSLHPDLPNAWFPPSPRPRCNWGGGDTPENEGCFNVGDAFPYGLEVPGIVGAADNGKYSLGVAPGTHLLLSSGPFLAPSHGFSDFEDSSKLRLPGFERRFCLTYASSEGIQCGGEDKEYAAVLGRYSADYSFGYVTEVPSAAFIDPRARTTDLATLNARLAERRRAEHWDEVENIETLLIDDKDTSGTREDWADDTLRAHPSISNLVAINIQIASYALPRGSYSGFLNDEDKDKRETAQIYYGSFHKQMEALGAYSFDPEENPFMDRLSPWKRLLLRLGRLGVVSVLPSSDSGTSYMNQRLEGIRKAGGPAPKGNPPYALSLSLFAETVPYVLSVVGVDKDNENSDSYSQCGTLKGRCLAAPKGSFPTLSSAPSPSSSQRISFDGNIIEGTTRAFSYAVAPAQVTGAVALAASFFKPTMRGYDGVKAAQRILDTAHGLGTCAGMRGKACRDAGLLDDKTGHGLLDIEAALKPVGKAEVPSGQKIGQGAPIALDGGHEAKASAAFGGLGKRLSKAARSAVAIDDLNHAFAGLAEVDISTTGSRPLSDLFHSRSAPSAAGFSTPIGGGSARLALANGTGADTSAAPEAAGIRSHFASTAWGLETPARLLSGASEVSLSFAPGTAEDGAPGRGGRFWASMTSRRLSIAERTTRARQNPSDEPGKSLLRLGWTGPVGSASLVRIEAARLSEDREALGGTTSGLFGELARARTDLISLGAEWEPAFGPASDRAGGAAAWTLLGEITAGRLSARASGSLLSRWESAALSGWALAARRERAAPGGGSSVWGFSASQPLRAESGAVALDLPVALQEDGETLAIDRRRVPLAASGRELRLEVSHERAGASGASLKGRVIRRLEAGHDADADPETGLALELRLPF